MRILTASIVFVLSFSSAGAAEFFQENATPLTESEISEYSTTDPIVTAANNDTLVIDDMMFLKAQLLTQGFSGNKWTNGEFIYEFDSGISNSNRNKFREACKVWEDVSAVTCTERTNQTNYVFVVNSPNNRSFVGMVGGRQTMELFNWGWKYVIAHEIGHALGLSHEQSRSDRDTYVIIHETNIRPGAQVNFRKRNTTNYTPYDFRSIMHYKPNAFSINNGPTITPQPDWLDQGQHMGNRSYLSAQDAAGMASRYGAN